MIWLNEKHDVFGKEQILVCEGSRREIVRDVRDGTGSAGLNNILKILNIMLNIVNAILLGKQGHCNREGTPSYLCIITFILT